MDPLAELVGDSPAIASLREEIQRLVRRQSGAGRQPPVLLQGETGTGKGLLAHVLHRASLRAGGPFVDINCSAIPDTLLEAELFGYERGAFTDARSAKPGLFQTAHGGTLFLDEVGLLAPALQSKLLQALEAGVVRRLGATRSEPVHVWVVAATNEDLADAVRAGRFRADLYHRLAVLTLVLPPLRTRGHDVTLLAERFLRHFSDAYELPGKSLGEGARAALLAYRWPGNVRELANVIERAVLLSDSPLITADTLELSRQPGRGTGASLVLDPARLKDPARRELLDALTQTSWNVSRTAARLGISRNTVRARIRRYGLARGEAATEPAPSNPADQAAAAQGPTPGLPAAAGPAAPVVLRWEKRRVALLRLGLGTAGEEDLTPLRSSRWLQIMIDKVRSFGGQVEGISSLGIDAVFGIERAEPCRRAAHAALAVRQRLTSARSRGQAPAIRVAIHACQVLVVHAGGPGRIDEESRRRMEPVMDAILAAAAPGSIVVSGTTATLLRRHFSLQDLEQAAAGLTLYQISVTSSSAPARPRPSWAARTSWPF